MKINHPIGITLAVLATLLFLSPSRAADITATGSGNWSSTVPDAPWPGGIVPGTNDSVDVEAPFVITVDADTTCAYLYGSGTVTLAPNVTLDILGDTVGAQGAQQLATLNATATGCTVNYHGNSFWAKRTDYYHLTFSGAGDFYNGAIPGSGAVPMNIAGNLLISGTNVAVQQGADITIGGNLSILGATNKWDTSSFYLTVGGNTTITGLRALLVDLDGALGSNYFTGSMTVGSSALAWNVSDVTQWALGGSLTNLGLIAGKGYGSIDFKGNGIITGNALKLPTITVSGTYEVRASITLTTNTPTLTGTLIFDLARTNQLTLQSYPTNPLTLYYDGALNVINTGAAPIAGNSYKFFNATNYDGSFVTTSFPTLAGGLSWADNLIAGGSIAVVGGPSGSPTLTYTVNGQTLTLSWDSGTYTGYRVIAQTNSSGIGATWSPTGSGTVSPYITTINPANPAVFYRLVKP
ncbi:MAG: hypothetical protein HOP33_01385 [Verrucomicrobia bacterium]|nr:hypothetical protein [Verrucomicrobiota bacterium]